MLETLNASRPLDTANLVNRRSPLNRGRTAWFLCLPHLNNSGPAWYEIAGGLTASGAQSGYTFGGSTRPGSFGRMSGGNPQYSAPATSPALTAAAWYFSPTPSGYRMMDTWTGSAGWILENASDGSTKFWINAPGGGTINAAATFTPSAWTHACGTYDGANIKLYINGRPAATTAQTGSASAGTSTLFLARAPQLTTNFYDDLTVYSRALSAAEVFALYSDSLAGYPATLNRIRPYSRQVVPPTSSPASLLAWAF